MFQLSKCIRKKIQLMMNDLATQIMIIVDADPV